MDKIVPKELEFCSEEKDVQSRKEKRKNNFFPQRSFLILQKFMSAKTLFPDMRKYGH